MTRGSLAVELVGVCGLCGDWREAELFIMVYHGKDRVPLSAGGYAGVTLGFLNKRQMSALLALMLAWGTAQGRDSTWVTGKAAQSHVWGQWQRHRGRLTGRREVVWKRAGWALSHHVLSYDLTRD